MKVSDLFESTIINGKDVSNEPRWKQTSMDAEKAKAKYGKENVRVKSHGLRNGADLVEILEMYEKDVDMLGKKHEKCGGTFKETSIQDDMHGTLHCSKCNKQINRRPVKEAEVSEGRWVKGAGGVPLGKDGNPVPAKAIRKVIAAYSQPYWDAKKYDEKYAGLLPSDKIEDGELNGMLPNILKDHGFSEIEDYTTSRKGSVIVDGVKVATIDLRVQVVYDLSDMGYDAKTIKDHGDAHGKTLELVYVQLRRDTKKPARIIFNNFAN